MKDSGEIIEILINIAAQTGAAAMGVSPAAEVDAEEWQLFCNWLEDEKNAGMDYMRNYPEIRRDPRMLLPEAKTVVSLAFNFALSQSHLNKNLGIATYAAFEDYHKTIRKTLSPLLKKHFPKGGDVNWRICIDSAPILERYWALKSGIGFRADNGMITIPNVGSRIFLAEIILDKEISGNQRTPWFATPISKMPKNCGHCGKCKRSCPGKALNSTVDCHRCISYLTIEHHGDWDETGKQIMQIPEGKESLFGCDRCLTACPWNKAPSHPSSILKLNKNIVSLTKEDLRNLSETDFIVKFANSPISRVGWEGWKRNTALSASQKVRSKK